MHKAGDIAAANNLITQSPNVQEASLKTNNPIWLLAPKKITIKQADKVMDSITDLVPADSDYKPKYYAALFRMGPVLFLELADRARTGKYPQHFFRVLIDGRKRSS